MKKSIVAGSVGILALLVLFGCTSQTSKMPPYQVMSTSMEDSQPLHGQYKDFGEYFRAVYPMRLVATTNRFDIPTETMNDMVACLWKAMEPRIPSDKMTELNDFARGNRPMTTEMQDTYGGAIPQPSERQAVFTKYCPDKVQEFKAAIGNGS